MTPPLLALVTSKTTYTVGSLSVILFTVSYYITYPPIVRDRCDNILVEAKYKHEYEVSHFGADFPKGRSSKQKSINQQVSHLSNHSNTSEYASGNHIVQFERKWITEGKHEFNIFQNDAIVFLHIQVIVLKFHSAKLIAFIRPKRECVDACAFIRCSLNLSEPCLILT